MLLIYFMLLGLAPQQIVQTLNLCFSVPSVAALYAGMRVRDRIDGPTYRRWLRGALWVMALLLLGQVSTRVLASDEELFRAIEDGKELVAEGLLVRGLANVDARNAERETPLHLAVEKGMKSLAQVLVQHGADLGARAKNGETALHLAALHADPSLVELLLAAGADPKARNDAGESVLMWAALSGHVAVARRLLERGADANVRDRKGSLPLHAAADGGHLELVRLLLARTADPDLKNSDGQSAADYARSRGYRRIELLLEGAD